MKLTFFILTPVCYSFIFITAIFQPFLSLAVGVSVIKMNEICRTEDGKKADCNRDV